MVDDIMNIICLEFMQNRNNNGSISNRCQESNRPMGTVTSANGNFISRLDAGTFQDNVKFSDFTRYILILKGNSFIVS